MRMFGKTNVEEKNGQPLVTPDMDGRFYQTVTAVPAIVLEESPKSAEVKRSMYTTVNLYSKRYRCINNVYMFIIRKQLFSSRFSLGTHVPMLMYMIVT